MRIQTKTTFPFLLIVFLAAIFLVDCSTSTIVEDDTYLTPIPESTLMAYYSKRPINSKLDAVLEAHSIMNGTRLIFTQGAPKVSSAEKMTLVEAQAIKNLSDERSGDIPVWFVIFEGSWQIISPDGDMLPLESGCIYIVFDANEYGRSHLGAGSCIVIP